MDTKPTTDLERFLYEHPQLLQDPWLRTLSVLGRYHDDPKYDFDLKTVDPRRLAKIASAVMHPPTPVVVYDERRFVCAKCVRVAREGRLRGRPATLMIARRSSWHVWRRTNWEIALPGKNTTQTGSYVVVDDLGLKAAGPLDEVQHRIHPALGLNIDDVPWPITLKCHRCRNSPRLRRERFEEGLEQGGEIPL